MHTESTCLQLSLSCIQLPFLSYFNLFQYYRLAVYPLALGDISDRLTVGIKQESYNPIFTFPWVFTLLKFSLPEGDKGWRSLILARLQKLGVWTLYLYIQCFRCNLLHSFFSWLWSKPLPNTLVFLPWLISHHHISPVVLISGESSPKLLFLCQSEACYQATGWPPPQHNTKTHTHIHTHMHTHTLNYTLDIVPKCNLRVPFPLLMWDMKWCWWQKCFSACIHQSNVGTQSMLLLKV